MVYSCLVVIKPLFLVRFFVFKKPWLREKVEVIHPWRKTERISPEVMSLIGEKYMLVFYDAPADKVYSKGGFKHPTNLKVVRIQD